MRMPAIAFAAAMAWAVSALPVSGEQLPGGLEIEPRNVYVCRDASRNDAWHYKCSPSSHGNMTMRFDVSNPHDSAQALRAEIPFSNGLSLWRGRGNNNDLTVHAATIVPPGGKLSWRIPVPFVGRLYGASGGNAKVKFVDAAGQAFLDISGLNYWHLYNPGLDSAWKRRGAKDEAGKDIRDSLEALRRFSRVNAIITDHAPAIKEMDTSFRAAFAKLLLDGEMAEGGACVNGGGNAKCSAVGFNSSLSCILPDFSLFAAWQDLSIFDLAIFAEEDWVALPESFRRIFMDWIASGASAVFLADAGAGEGLPPEGNFGLGEISHMKKAAMDWAKIVHLTASSIEAQTLSGASARFNCDALANETAKRLQGSVPLSLILCVLAVFAIISGPVAMGALAKKNKRINILWVFPLISVAFSAAVCAAIVFTTGIDPVLHQFAYTLFDEKAGKAVTVQHDVIMAPFPLRGEITYPASGTVCYDGGKASSFGKDVVYDGATFTFLDGWTPAMWPVSFRTVTVRNLKDAESLPADSLISLPVRSRLQKHTLSHETERRAAE